MDTETKNSPAYFPGLELPPADNTPPPAVKREWMDIPWKERNILSKICYVIATGLSLAIGLGLLGLIGSTILKALGIQPPPLADWWFWLLMSVLFCFRWFRLLVFIVCGAVSGGFILPIILDYHITNVEGFLIGAGVCAVVSALCVFAPRPRFHKREKQENAK